MPRIQSLLKNSLNKFSYHLGLHADWWFIKKKKKRHLILSVWCSCNSRIYITEWNEIETFNFKYYSVVESSPIVLKSCRMRSYYSVWRPLGLLWFQCFKEAYFPEHKYLDTFLVVAFFNVGKIFWNQSLENFWIAQFKFVAILPFQWKELRLFIQELQLFKDI